jgi:hypothetical protein
MYCGSIKETGKKATSKLEKIQLSNNITYTTQKHDIFKYLKKITKMLRKNAILLSKSPDCVFFKEN